MMPTLDAVRQNGCLRPFTEPRHLEPCHLESRIPEMITRVGDCPGEQPRAASFGAGGLKAVSLFSGAGGLDLGVHEAGFEVSVAVEYERDAAMTLRRNFFDGHPDRVIERSLTEVGTDEILERAGLRRQDVAMVFGGPPCTPFSKSGYWLEYKREGRDPRASLLDEFARVVEDIRPPVALMENVHGLAYRNQNAGPFGKLQDRLRGAGYHVRYAVLNAADYGVPQLRKRLFLYATLGAPPPCFPAPSHSGWTETSKKVDGSKLPYVTSSQAIGDLATRADLAEADEAVGGRFGHLLPHVPPGGNYLHFTAHEGHPQPLFEWRSRFWTFLLKLDPDRPATTIQAQPGPYVGPFHWNDRRLRVAELKRLQTFPDQFTFEGNRRSLQVQIGNAVPPLLARLVAQQLSSMLLGEVTVGADAPRQLALV